MYILRSWLLLFFRRLRLWRSGFSGCLVDISIALAIWSWRLGVFWHFDIQQRVADLFSFWNRSTAFLLKFHDLFHFETLLSKIISKGLLELFLLPGLYRLISCSFVLFGWILIPIQFFLDRQPSFPWLAGWAINSFVVGWISEALHGGLYLFALHGLSKGVRLLLLAGEANSWCQLQSRYFVDRWHRSFWGYWMTV